ncbi:MAG: glycosyl transferase [Alicyclobacillus sp. RIFOXYA1_FULL_53_8]|nr:MAG: glycosyl transferase [Alicyclobacillus sp. RIFOXYA1_FULL_53_8]
MSLSAEVGAQGFVHVLGVRFNRLNRQQVVEQILLWVAEQSRRMVITAGPEFVMMSQANSDVKRIIHAADIITPDGIGVVWAAKRMQKPVQERVTGVELIQQLLQTAQDRKQSLRVFVLGASNESLQRCLENFRNQYPQLAFAGRDGYFSSAEEETVLQEVRDFSPDLWLVGLGQPRQEKLIVESLRSLSPCVAIGVGGSIDVWGGTVKRAPIWFQRLNVEWLYRLLKQPSRWKRQLALPRFAWQVLKSRESHM